MRLHLAGKAFFCAALAVVAVPGDFGKPPPAVVVQSDLFADHPTVTLCPVTSTLTGASLFRVRVEPDAANGLRAVAEVMLDKLQTVKVARIGQHVGWLDATTGRAIDAALKLWLGW